MLYLLTGSQSRKYRDFTMNKHQKRCIMRAFCFAVGLSFVCGLCVGYFIWYAQLDFTLFAVSTGFGAVLIVALLEIGTSIANCLAHGRVNARRYINRTVRRARYDFVNHR